MKQKKQKQIFKRKKKSKIFKFYEKVVSKCYGKREIIGLENLPDEPCVIVGNHAQINGPLFSAVQYPRKKYVWCIGEMFHLKDLPAYAYQDFWSQKPKWTKWFYKMMSYVVTPLLWYVDTGADTIPVYKDRRGIVTFKRSIEGLKEGADIIIFPECHEKYNNIVNEFQDKFVDLAKMYFKDSKKEVCFVPMYSAPLLKKVVFGKPIRFNSADSIDSQRKAICEYLKEEITALAKELPEHTVVPYDNIAKKDYPKSK
jgi:1-acyl-sn-glycerol-3-phosphate acyltransferase